MANLKEFYIELAFAYILVNLEWKQWQRLLQSVPTPNVALQYNGYCLFI